MRIALGPRPLARVVAVGATLSALLGACSDDDVVVFSCDDGVVDGDQVCFEGEAQAITLDAEPIALRVADFDGDGLADALVTGLTGEGLVGALYRGTAGGASATPIDVGIHGCSGHPVVGDLDHDPYADLLVATCEAQVLLFRGTSTGVFEPAITQPIPTLAKMITLADVDGDGAQDLVVLGDDLQLHVLLAVGAAAYGPAQTSALDGAAPLAFAIVDVDRDRRGDAVVLTGDDLEIGLGRPGGVFSMQGAITAGPTPPLGLGTGDLDGDHKIDLLTRDGDDALVILRGDGAGGFSEGERIELSLTAVGPIVAADLDRDGDDELVVADADEPRLHAWYRKEGRLRGPVVIELPAPAVQLGVGDFNGDGAPDLAAATFSAGTLAIVLGSP
ncbi:MAG: VCBS repeat-containing protein [Nannocystaceae bacterium]